MYFCRLIAGLVTMAACLPLAESTVSYDEMFFESIPARFGLDWQPPSRAYQAHLQFLPERPRLCEAEEGGLEGLITPNDTLPVALLVMRGNCTFEEKAWVAMHAYPTVSFLVVYDNVPEKALVSMKESSDASEIKLGMLFVSHKAGMEFMAALNNQTAEMIEGGGPIIHLDGLDPLVMNEPSLKDLQTWILICMGGFFTFITVFGCLLVFVQLGVIPVNGAGQIILTPEAIRRARRLLTREEAARFQPGGDLQGIFSTIDEPITIASEEAPSDGDERASNSRLPGVDLPSDSEEDQNCAVCLDELVSSTGDEEGNRVCSTLYLPCGHDFHLECIVPWLTERQANCPLCKFDLLEFMLSIDEKAAPKNSRFSSAWWKHQARRLWGWAPIRSSESQADTSNSEERNGDELAAAETAI